MGAPLYAELRYWPELAGLLADGRFRSPARAARRVPVLLIPGFMAGDSSLTLLARWLRRRGHTVRMSGIRINAGCAGRELARLERVLEGFDESAIVIGQSRGGTLARALAARHPEAVAAVVMLGAPVLDPLAVSPSVMRSVRSVARLGDLGVPGVFSSECRAGDCCTDYYALLKAPLTAGMVAVMVYSRSDAIVDWRACLDPSATCIEVDGSHCGMAVNARVYEELERVLERAGAAPV
ncbi:MAG TPA: alpha/beta fold hydrolase [Solirubrobacteraceae bacterium]|jgi:pimeloyl-ACP methyl ester carboxylesterase|nr:alpha/beta fold hydrolase [Solirubrobacteraceae bacterium]